MKNLIVLIYLMSILFVAGGITFSQSIPQKFFDALINDKAEITDFVNNDELSKSNRLGINYTGVKNKFMLGYDLPDEIKTGLRSGKYKYALEEQLLTDNYTQVTFSVPEANFSKVYYFNMGFVTNSTYYTKSWVNKESKYFSYKIEEPRYFNDYCIKRLDDFVDMIADTLGYTISEKRILEKEKLGYIFCADEKGVEKITGFNAKGLAMLGTDEVVTSYQTHFHEVAHLLINYKLKTLGLYTLPFFMEGFAVAVGGRGGMAPRVVTDLGYFLQKTGQLTYDSILTFNQFRSIDGSMTYPVSGLYNSFLLSELGGEKYLELYKKVNGDLEYVKKLDGHDYLTLKNVVYVRYLEKHYENNLLYVDFSESSQPEFNIQGANGNITFVNDHYKFFVIDHFLISIENNENVKNYRSRILSEIYSDSGFSPTKYCIVADSANVKVYDLWNDELILSYTNTLSMTNMKIPFLKRHGGDYYTFFIRKDIFKNDFDKGYMIEGCCR